MTSLLLVLRATLGLATPSEMVGDRLTAFISIKQFFSLLDQFGGYSGLSKPAAEESSSGQLVAGTLAGVLLAVLVERRRARPVLVASVIVAVLWLATLGLLWPNLATNYGGRPTTWVVG